MLIYFIILWHFIKYAHPGLLYHMIVDENDVVISVVGFFFLFENLLQQLCVRFVVEWNFSLNHWVYIYVVAFIPYVVTWSGIM